MKKFDNYWEYLLRQKHPWARLTNVCVTPIILVMAMMKAFTTGQPYFWVICLFVTVMGFQQHRHYWNKWNDKHR